MNLPAGALLPVSARFLQEEKRRPCTRIQRCAQAREKAVNINTPFASLNMSFASDGPSWFNSKSKE